MTGEVVRKVGEDGEETGHGTNQVVKDRLRVRDINVSFSSITVLSACYASTG